MTIAISVMLSAFNAAHSQPGARGSIAAAKKPEEGTYKRRGPLGKFFDVFNRYWESSTNGFVRWSHAGNSQGRARAWCCWQASVWARFFFWQPAALQFYAG